MLKADDMEKKDASVKCLEVMSTSRPEHWKAILLAVLNISAITIFTAEIPVTSPRQSKSHFSQTS